MKFDLATLARRQRNIRKSAIVLHEVSAPAMLATDLFNTAYRPTINLWTQAAPRIADEYARTLASLTTDAPSDIQAQIDGAEAAFQRLFFALTPSLRSWALRVESSVRQRFVRQVFSATSVELSTLLGPSDVIQTVEAVIARNVALVRDVSQQIQGRISDAVFRGLTERLPAREVAAEINNAVSLGRKRSLRIASHQLSAMSATLAQERRRQAGLFIFRWNHSSKRYPRESHLARDGVLYSEDPALVGKKVEGKTVRAAPDASTRAGVEPNCGCRESGVLVFEFDEEA